MKEPKIGLALGSGGAKGFAHIGVIKVLRENDIPIHLIAGSSMGALVGTFYAASSNVERLYKMANVLRGSIIWILRFRKWGLLLENVSKI